MSIEVMGGGGGYAEYKMLGVSATVSTQSTNITTPTLNKNQYPNIILQIRVVGYRYTSSSTQTLFDYYFPFNDGITEQTINGTYGAGSFGRATIQEILTNTSDGPEYSFVISGMQNSSGGTIYFYPNDGTNYYNYVIQFRGYNPV